MIAGAPGACGSLVSLSSSDEAGWNPTPAFASCATNIHIASPNTTHLPKRNIVDLSQEKCSISRGVEKHDFLQAGTTNSRGTSSARCGHSKFRLLRISGPPRARIRTYSKRLSIARSARPSSEEIAADSSVQFSVLSSQFSVLSHGLSVLPNPVQSCHLGRRRGLHEVKSLRSRKACPERSRRDRYTLSGGKDALGNFPVRPVFLPIYCKGNKR